ncbi:MAG: glutathione S-transferase family protein [Alphaproteobacteria bacterium]|nr:glutathione S-transferase family protein [Alphaproteobacteria bacterium]MBL6937740.1 glutathione S-transferase family protein [Alphaproteobacteria bacterium]MBL7099078.1 glutathione S-transferase family protein [Alphaproteobacteria bacterium]
MTNIVFHSMPDSAYLWTAMHVADEKGAVYTFQPLVYRSDEHLRLHPFGKMPVMQHGEFWLYETAAIAHYIDRAFVGPALQPDAPRGQADVIRWISIVNNYVFPVMNRFTKERLVRPAWGFEPDKAFIDSAREPLLVQTRLIEEAVAAGGFLVGSELTLADCFLLPHLLFFSLTPEGRDLTARLPNARAWLDRMTQRPALAQSPMMAAFAAMSAGADRAGAARWAA